jgi:hypothetical protein
MQRIPVALLVAASVCACDGSSSAGESADASSDGEDFCEAYAAFALEQGCAGQAECEVEPACNRAAFAFLACVRQDASQCYCKETGMELNCEGAYKEQEGPALCVSEYQSLQLCLDAATDSAELELSRSR